MTQPGENVIRSYGGVGVPNNHSKYHTRGCRVAHGTPVQLERGHGGPDVEAAPPLLGETLDLDLMGGEKAAYGLVNGIGTDAVQPYPPLGCREPVRERGAHRR